MSVRDSARVTLAASLLILCGACSSLWRPWLEYRQPCNSDNPSCPSGERCNPQAQICEPIPPNKSDLGGATPEFKQVGIDTLDPLFAVWGSDENNVWIVGGADTTSSIIRQWDGRSFITHQSPVMQRLSGVWGLNKNNVWAVGNNAEVLTWNGNTWQRYMPVIGAGRSFNGIWGTDLTHIWAVGTTGGASSEMYFWNGTSWQPEPHTPILGLSGISGLDSGTIMTVGLGVTTDGDYLVWNGVGWMNQNLTPPQPPLHQVYAYDRDHFWAVGNNGTILQLGVPSQVTIQASGTANHLYGVWASDEKSVWAVGKSGTILKRIDNIWVAQPSPTDQDLHAVWGYSANDVWAVGARGTVLHYKP